MERNSAVILAIKLVDNKCYSMAIYFSNKTVRANLISKLKR